MARWSALMAQSKDDWTVAGLSRPSYLDHVETNTGALPVKGHHKVALRICAVTTEDIHATRSDITASMLGGRVDEDDDSVGNRLIGADRRRVINAVFVVVIPYSANDGGGLWCFPDVGENKNASDTSFREETREKSL